ncbi:MAG: TldD/PmbA family protein [Actinomycetota bacterium]|nr:TldD/PmbA family protein [Actinomycetota bacterium]
MTRGLDDGSVDLGDVARRIAEMAAGSEQVEAYVARRRETAVRVYDGAVESLTSATSTGIGVRVVRDGRQGFASTGSLSAGGEAGAHAIGPALAAVLDAARTNAAFASPDDNGGIAEPDGIAPADLGLWRDETVATPVADKIALAVDLDRRLRDADSRVRQVPSSNYGDVASEVAIATSAGIRAATRRTSCHLSASVLVGTGAKTQSGTGFAVGRAPGDLDAEEAAQDALDRALRLLGARKGTSGEVTVVFDPRVTAVVLSVIAGALAGDVAVKGRSMFTGRLGESVAAGHVTLVDDPTDARAFSAASVDAEGMACRRNVLVDAGVLRGFVHDSRSGRMAGTGSSGSAVRGGYATTPGAGCRALVLRPATRGTGRGDGAPPGTGGIAGTGGSGRDEILAMVGEGLYVQSVTGVHSGANPVSGDFSVAAEGVRIAGGGFAEPVREVTIASTLQRMLASVLAIGSDIDWLPGIAAGQTVAIEGMRMSGR